MEEQFKIWFTEFYEGEGSISNDISNSYRIRVSVSQNDISPLLEAKKIWGGSVIKRVRTSPASGKICTGHEWYISHKQSMIFIDDIKKYMRIPYKIKQMENVLDKFYNKPERFIYKCNFCEKEYANPASRRRHEKKEHIEKGVLHKCDILNCTREFKSKDTLNRHKRINHKNTDASPI